MVVEGQFVEAGMALFKIIDYANLWALCDVYQQDLPFVVLGQKAELNVDFIPGHSYVGSVTYIAPELNMESRTVGVRVELSNSSELSLKPGMAATALLKSLPRREAVSVPDEAVIHSGLRTIVVIALGGGYFEPREVKVGLSAEGYTEILDGVDVEDEIVVSSQFLIDSESNLKAAIEKLTSKN